MICEYTKQETGNRAKDCHACTSSGWGMYLFIALYRQVCVTVISCFCWIVISGYEEVA